MIVYHGVLFQAMLLVLPLHLAVPFALPGLLQTYALVLAMFSLGMGPRSAEGPGHETETDRETGEREGGGGRKRV